MTYRPVEYWNALSGHKMLLSEVGWPNWTEAYNKARYKLSLEQVSHIIDELPTSPKNILEVGCGVGFWTRFLTQRFPDSSYQGVDISAAAVTNLKKQYSHLSNTSFTQGDVSSIVLPANNYDLVVCLEVLLHIVDDALWEQAIHTIANALSSTGYALLSDPLTMWCDPPGYTVGDNCKVRKMADLQRVLERHGLEILQIHPRTFFLDNNYDFKHAWARRCWNVFFHRYCRLLSIKSEALGSLLGRCAYHFDRWYTSTHSPGHSCKLTVIRPSGVW